MGHGNTCICLDYWHERNERLFNNIFKPRLYLFNSIRHFVKFLSGNFNLPLKRKVPASSLEFRGRSFLQSTARGTSNQGQVASHRLDVNWSAIRVLRPPILQTYSRRRASGLASASLGLRMSMDSCILSFVVYFQLQSFVDCFFVAVLFCLMSFVITFTCTSFIFYIFL